MKNIIIVFFVTVLLTSCNTQKEKDSEQNQYEIVEVSLIEAGFYSERFEQQLNELCEQGGGAVTTGRVGRDSGVSYDFPVKISSDSSATLHFFKKDSAISVEVGSTNGSISYFADPNTKTNHYGAYYYNATESTKGRRLFEFSSEVDKLIELYKQQNPKVIINLR